MAAGPGESPAVARRRVRLALRRARAAVDPSPSQADVAKKLGWSHSKMQRIESGDVTISGTDLRALLDFYGGFTAAEIGELLEDARISRRQRWWTKPEYREHLTPSVMKLMSFEAGAAEIRVYQSGLVPGILQTPETAHLVLDFWLGRGPEERVRIRQEVRLLRRRSVIEAEEGPIYRLVLDESVLLRRLGGARVAADQVAALAEAAALPRVRIRVLPLDKGALLSLLGPFVIVDLDEPGSDDAGDAVLYREVGDQDSIVDDPGLVGTHRDYFAQLWNESLDEDVSLRLITAQAAVLRSDADRRT